MMLKKSPKAHTEHGVFVDVNNTGVLLVGESGIGKSELALGLIDRGHCLVADDSVLFSQKDNQVVGSCPELLQDFLEVRGLGVINIRQMFGDKSIKENNTLELIVKIIQIKPSKLHTIDRLHGLHDTQTILGSSIPRVSIPVAPGRSLTILVEAAVKNYKLQKNGYHASLDFTEKHQDIMGRTDNDC